MLRGAVVGTLMTNLGLELALQAQGIGLVRTKVGDRYILERLRQEGWTLGGEPSGHIICLDRTTTGDGTVSALQVLAEMMRTGRSLRELRDGLSKFPQRLINVRLARGNADAAMHASPVQAAVREVEAELGAGGRVLLRPSGTEPLLRVMVEGEEAGQVERLAGQIAERCGPRWASGVRSLGRDHDDLDAAVASPALGGRVVGDRPRHAVADGVHAIAGDTAAREVARHRHRAVLRQLLVHRAEPVLSVWPSTSMRVLPYWFSVRATASSADRTAADGRAAHVERDALRQVQEDVVALPLHVDAGAGGLGAQGALLLVHVVADGAAGECAHGRADEAARGAVTAAGNLAADQRARRGADHRSAGGLGALLRSLAACQGEGAKEQGYGQDGLVHRRAPLEGADGRRSVPRGPCRYNATAASGRTLH